MALALHAPAKVNLFLEVLGRRPDGYHELRTVLHTLALHDTLIAESQDSATTTLTLSSAVQVGLPVSAGDDNLLCRAARGFQTAAGMTRGFRFHLEKRIPAGGGLGGGSSDAAAALQLMNRLAGDALSAQDLQRIASSLGADVPFFLRGGTQLGEGIGDRLTPLQAAPHLHFLLILPPTGTSTQAVYKNHGAHLTGGPRKASIPSDKVPDYKELALPSGFPNHLEAAALQLHPELAELRRAVVGRGFPQVRMSGSGSTFFLAFRDAVECADAMDTLARLRERGVDLLQTESRSVQQGEPWSEAFPDPADN